MRILFTGSDGFLGSRLVALLRAQGHEVTPCDLARKDEFRCDIRSYRQLARALGHHGHHDMIFHFAAEFGRANGNEYYEQMWSTNVLGTQNVLTFASQTSTPIVFASSSEIYGHLADEFPGLMETLPFSQTPHHQNLYALSKWVNEQQIVISGVPFVILRIFNVYGPGETYAPYRSVVVRFLGDALKGQPSVITPGSKRQFLYIDDFCRTVARIPDCFDSVHHMTFNLAGDEVLTTEELAELCGQTKLIAYQDPTTAGVKVASCELAERFLGHDPQVPLEEGIAWTRQWLKSVL